MKYVRMGQDSPLYVKAVKIEEQALACKFVSFSANETVFCSDRHWIFYTTTTAE